MEFILTLILIYGGYWLLGVLLRSAGAATKAAARTIGGKGTFSENFDVELKGMGPFDARLVPTKVDISGRQFDALEVQIRGLIGATRQAELVFVTSLFDFEGNEWAPMLSSVDLFQEPNTRAFQNKCQAGTVAPDQGFVTWVKVATIFPETLIGKRSGNRPLRVYVRALPLGEENKIELGRHEKGTEIFAAKEIDCEVVLAEKGYSEAREERNKARALSVKIAVYVAMASGDLTEPKARVIQKWIKQELELQENDQALKQLLNDALREAYSGKQNGRVSLDADLFSMLELGLKANNIALLELCVDVASTEARIDEAGLKLARKVAASLDVDFDEVQAMSDKKLLQMDAFNITSDSLEAFLGIDGTWDQERIKGHLRAEFIKWNGRIQTLSEGTEKQHAQKMLNAIASARAKYAAG